MINMILLAIQLVLFVVSVLCMKRAKKHQENARRLLDKADEKFSVLTEVEDNAYKQGYEQGIEDGYQKHKRETELTD